jgi:hypothetical protein
LIHSTTSLGHRQHLDEELAFFVFGTILSEGRGYSTSSPAAAPPPHVPWAEVNYTLLLY